MNQNGQMKVLVAFAAGVVLALGGAVAYVRVSERAPSVPVKQASISTPAPSALPDAGLNTPPPSPATPVTTAAAPAKPSHPELRAMGHKYNHNGQANQSQQLPSDRPQQEVAQNVPPPSPSPANPYALPSPVAQNAPAQRPAVQEPTSQPPLAPAAPPPPRTVTLDAGTSIVVRLVQAVSTKTLHDGDSFRASLQLPIVRDGAVIAERGSSVVGRVVASDRAGRVKGKSDLQLSLSEISTTDGQHIPVDTAILDRQGASGKRGDAAKMGGGAALGAIIGAIAGGGKGAAIGAGAGGAAGAGDVLLTRGKDVEIPSETELTFRLSRPVVITEQLR